MSKFLIVVLAAFLLITCNNTEEGADFNSQRAILEPKPIDFNSNILSGKLAEWQEQGINYYSFIEKHTNTGYPPENYTAKVTIVNNNIIGIEMFDEEYIRSDYINNQAGEMIRNLGDISGIYKRLLAWHQEASAALGKYQKINCKITYNEQYIFPEYLEFGVYAYQYIGNNTWSACDGAGSRIIEISNFTVYEEPPFNNVLEMAYDKNYKYPDGFYHEENLIGSVYYENTLSIKPINERNDYIELHTLNKEEARNWSNLSNEYSSVNRVIIQENETEKYFEFVRKNVNPYNENDILLSRVHKSDYFIPMRNLYFLHGYGFNEENTIGIFNGDLTISNVKELIEFLWDYPNRQNGSSKVAKTEISEQGDKFEYYIQEICIIYGDYGVYDMIYIYDITFTLDKNTRILSLTDKKLIREIRGIKR